MASEHRHGSSVGPGATKDDETAEDAVETPAADSVDPGASDTVEVDRVTETEEPANRTEDVTETTHRVVTEPADQALDQAVKDAREQERRKSES